MIRKFGLPPVLCPYEEESLLPWSYTVETPTGQVRRNRQYLNMVPEPSQSSNLLEQEAPLPSWIMMRSQTGIMIHPPRDSAEEGDVEY